MGDEPDRAFEQSLGAELAESNRLDSQRPFASGKTRAFVVIALFGLGVFVSLLCIGADIGQFELCERMVRGEAVTDGELERNEQRHTAIGAAMSFQYLALVVAYLTWIYRAHANLPALGAADLEFSPKGAVGWYFAPFFNWYKPYQVMREIYNASDPSYSLQDGDAWRTKNAPFLLKMWWWAFLLMNLFARSSMRLGFSAETASDFQAESAASVVSEVLSIAAALPVIWLVWSIDQRQTERASSLAKMSGLG